MRGWISLGLLMLMLLLGCGGIQRTWIAATGGALNGQIQLLEIESSGRKRSAWVHVPLWLSEPAPLVIVMHGGGSRTPDLKGRAAAQSWEGRFNGDVVYAFPNGLFEGVRRNPADPDASPRPWFVWDEEGDQRFVDLVFLRDLIDAIDADVDIHRGHVYLTGFSAGGQFTWYAACADPEPYAGFAVVGMLMDRDLQSECEPHLKRPLIYLHGEADARIPIEGSEARGTRDETVDWLLSNRRCARFANLERSVPGMGGFHARGAVHQCRTVRSVELWRIEGAEHCWPRSGKCSGVDASGLILDYWRRTAGMPGASP